MAPRQQQKKTDKTGATATGGGGGGGGGDGDGISRDIGRTQVNLGDTASLRHELDTTATEVILDRGLEENLFVSNVKIGLGLIAIALALVAQFYPGKYADNWRIIFSCVCGYVVVTAVLSAFCARFEGNSILITKPKKGVSETALKVSSVLPRFSDTYTLTIESASKGDKKFVQLKESITKYFHSDGYLSTDTFRGDVKNLLREFEGKN